MNEKKFHQDEFAMLLGNQMNARMEEGGQVLSTQLARFSKLLLISPIFGLISCLKTVDPVSPVDKFSDMIDLRWAWHGSNGKEEQWTSSQLISSLTPRSASQSFYQKQ